MSPKRPSTADADTTGVPAAALNDPSTGKFGADSNAECRIDGRRRETITWQGSPVAGLYYIYANVYDACGKQSTRFHVRLHRAVPGDTDGTWRVETTTLRTGSLFGVSANGGGKPPLYVTALSLP